jgi:hypothetical protein
VLGDESLCKRPETAKDVETYLQLPIGACMIAAEFVTSHFDPQIQRSRNLGLIQGILHELSKVPWSKLPDNHSKDSLPTAS